MTEETEIAIKHLDTSKLDANQTYICLEIGNSLTAKALQELQHKVFSNIAPEEIASHVLS